MVSDSSASRTGNDIFGFDRRLVAVALVVGLVAAGGVAATTMLGFGDDGEETETNAQLDSVPAGVDGVLYVDGNVTDDELTLDMLDEGLDVGWWVADNGVAPDISVVLETLDTANITYENTTVFLKGAEDGQANYAGSVLNFGEGSEAGDMISLLEDQIGDLEEDSYSGVDVYKTDLVDAAEEADVENVTDDVDITGVIREFIGVETTAWVATPDDDTVILGSEQAATDAIDVYQDEADPVGGELRDAHEVAAAGPVEATVSPDIVDQPVVEVVGVVSTDAAALLSIAGHDPELLSVTYDVRDRQQETITFDVVATMGSKSEAGDLYGAMDARYDPSTAATTPEEINDSRAIQRAAGEQNGKYFHLEIPTIPLQTPTYLAKFVDEYGPTPGPLELVPDPATGVVQIDPGANDTDGSFAATLAGSTAGTSEADVREMLGTDGVTYDSATTFYGEGDYTATYVELGNQDAEQFIQTAVRRQYQQQTGTDILENIREDHKGYEHVDIYRTTGLDRGLNITRALSGFVANGTTEWVAPISNTSVLFGSMPAVRDAVDIFRGLAASPRTPLHETHARTNGTTLLSSARDDGTLATQLGTESVLGSVVAGQDPAAATIARTAGSDGLTVRLAADDESGAAALADALSTAIDDATTEDNTLDTRTTLDRDGRYVGLDITGGLEGLVADPAAVTDGFVGLAPGAGER